MGFIKLIARPKITLFGQHPQFVHTCTSAEGIRAIIRSVCP